ncbi:MAG: hypothetical protein HOF97_03050, partial [Candidatus Marinimicrobia bacterium]|nr:hypothetical protein [Candidatus Neomarinimicrobiota bacterium]
MKKVAILFIVLLTSSFVFAQNTYVPDDKFEQALIDLGYDTTLDDSVLTANISGVTVLDVSSKSISDLTGIEAFTSLIDLSCAFNQLTSLDVSRNTALTQLHCNNNQLTYLNMRNGVKEQLSNFNAKGNPSLTCIETLDPSYATANWTSANGNIDAGVTFTYICGVDVDGVSTYNNNGIKAITFNVELPTHSIPDTNISLAFWKSGAQNNE